MNFLLDTNIISEVRKGSRCHENVALWYAEVDSESLFLSVLVLGEIRKGIESSYRHQPDKAMVLEKWFHVVTDAFVGRILPVYRIVAEEWGRMNVDRTFPVIDGLLAATAKVNDMILVSRNIADLHGSGAKLLNPFEGNTATVLG